MAEASAAANDTLKAPLNETTGRPGSAGSAGSDFFALDKNGQDRFSNTNLKITTNLEVQCSVDEDGVRELQNLSLGNTAALYTPLVHKKPTRALKPTEIANYDGAGIMACTMIAGKLHCLLTKPKKGKKKGIRWFDIGGKKAHNAELPSDCASRKFTKYTYGLFSLDANFSNGKEKQIQALLKETYSRKDETWPLIHKSGTDWCKKWMLESDTKCYFNTGSRYHVYLMPVHFIKADIFQSVSEMMEGNKREFQWIPHDVLTMGPLASRIQVRSLYRQLGGVGVMELENSWRGKEEPAAPCVATFHQ